MALALNTATAKSSRFSDGAEAAGAGCGAGAWPRRGSTAMACAVMVSMADETVSRSAVPRVSNRSCTSPKNRVIFASHSPRCSRWFFAGAGGWAEDFGEEFIELGTGEASGFSASALPVLEGADVDTPFFGSLRLAEVEGAPGIFDAFGEAGLSPLPWWVVAVHGLILVLLRLAAPARYDFVICMILHLLTGYAVDSPSPLLRGRAFNRAISTAMPYIDKSKTRTHFKACYFLSLELAAARAAFSPAALAVAKCFLQNSR